MPGVVRKPLVASTQTYDTTTPTATAQGGDPGGRDPIPAVPKPTTPTVPAPTTPAPTTPAPTTPAPTTPTTPAGRTTPYDPAAGWDVGKLNDPTVTDAKYNFGRAAEDYGGVQRGNLQGLVDYYNKQYSGNAKVTGDDTIDFGQNYGPVDVINGDTNGLQWLVPGDGGGASAASAASAGALSGLMDQIKAQADKMTAAQKVTDYGPPATAGVFDPTATQQVGQDPFSQTITDAYGALIKSQQDQLAAAQARAGIGITDQQRAQSLEAARMPYEMARKVQLTNAQADLANRGLISEPGHLSGGETGAVDRIETNLAPAYTQAIADRMGALDTLGEQQQQDVNASATTLANTLAGGTGRQTALSNIAIANLEQNRLWQQFITQFGLDSEKVNSDIATGNTSQYLQLLQLWLQGANIAAGGFI